MSIDTDKIKAEVQEAYDVAEATLTHLREQRVKLNEAIKEAVTERDEAKRLLSAMTPRTRKPKNVEQAEPASAD